MRWGWGDALRCTVEHDFLCLLPRCFPFLFFIFTLLLNKARLKSLRVCRSQEGAASEDAAIKPELLSDSAAAIINSMVFRHVAPYR